MNPDKLFDYLDGRLSPADRAALEEKLMSDAQLRREFNIAREIHRSGGVSRETIMPLDPEAAEKGGRIGRRIAVAAIALVFLNVFIGLGVITWKRSKPPPATDTKEAVIRQQLAASLGAAAQNAMPAPSLSDDEIALTAARTEWENLSKAVVDAAEACGGSAVKDIADEGATITASIPRDRVAEFRKKVLGPTAAASSHNAAAGEIATIQIRIAEAAR